MLGVRSAVEPEFKVLLALPKLLRGQPEDLSSLLGDRLLVVVIVLGVVGHEGGGVAILVEKELGEIAVLEGELETGRLVVVEGKQSHSEGVDYPLRLELQLGDNCRSMGPNLVHHFLRIVQTPCRVISRIDVVFGPVVDPSFSTWELTAGGQCLEFLLGLADSFEVVRMLFLIDVVRVFVDGEGEEESSGECGLKPCNHPHCYYLIINIINSINYHTFLPSLPLGLFQDMMYSCKNLLSLLIIADKDEAIPIDPAGKHGHQVQSTLHLLPKDLLLSLLRLPPARSSSHFRRPQKEPPAYGAKFRHRIQPSTPLAIQSDKVEDSIKLMILIHLSLDESVPERFINRCQINPSQSTSHYRTDLQFYVRRP